MNASLVMEGNNDDRSINGFSTACSIFEDLFVFVEVNQSFPVLLVVNGFYSWVIKIFDSLYELFWDMAECLPSLYVSSRSWMFVSSIFRLRSARLADSSLSTSSAELFWSPYMFIFKL